MGLFRGWLMPVTRRARHHQPLTRLTMLFHDDPLPENEYMITRKYFDHKLHGGPKLTRAERQRMARMHKRDTKSFIVDMTVFMLLGGPLLWFVMSKAH